MRLALSTTTLYFLSLVFASAYAQPGSLDAAFDNDGVVATLVPLRYWPGPTGSTSQGANTAALQADGKILVAATSTINSTDSTVLMRFNTDGSIDSGFGMNGAIRFIGGKISSIVTEPLGSIITCLVGDSHITQSILYRFFPDGTKDTSFHPVVPVHGLYYTGINDLKLQPDGKIIAAGNTDLSDRANFLIRFLSNGDLDSSFGINGLVKMPTINFSNYIAAITLQADGKIIAAGDATKSPKIYFFAERFLDNGILDSSFGNNGFIHTAFGENAYSYAKEVSVQTDNRIILGGFTSSINYADTSTNFAIVCYLSDGNIDTAFGTNGLVQTDFNNHADVATSMTLDQDGKLIAAGYETNSDSSTSIALVRYLENGFLDSSFGNNGKVITNVGEDSWGNKILFQTDNKIVVAGGVYSISYDNIHDSTHPYIVLTRYITDNVLALTLTDFNAVKKTNSVLLTWQDVSNINTDYFSVERSKDGIQFSPIARIKSKPNNSQIQLYNYEDAHPFEGANFYRLQQVDISGEINNSKTLLIQFDKVGRVYPNPVKDVLHIDGLHSNAINNLSIIDLNGRIVKTITTKENYYTWNVRSLAKGFYYLRIETDSIINTIQFVKE